MVQCDHHLSGIHVIAEIVKISNWCVLKFSQNLKLNKVVTILWRSWSNINRWVLRLAFFFGKVNCALKCTRFEFAEAAKEKATLSLKSRQKKTFSNYTVSYNGSFAWSVVWLKARYKLKNIPMKSKWYAKQRIII